MPGLSELKLRLGIPASDRQKDELLVLLLGRAGTWARGYCRLAEGEDGAIAGAVVEMAAHDYALLGAEGVGTRTLSGLSESYHPDYPEHIMAALRASRRIGVPS